MDINVYLFPEQEYDFKSLHYTWMESIYDNQSKKLFRLSKYIFEEGIIWYEGPIELSRATSWITQCQYCETKYHPSGMLLIDDHLEKCTTVMCPRCYKQFTREKNE